MNNECIVITISLTKVALVAYAVAKVALAVYLQRLYLANSNKLVKRYGSAVNESHKDLWILFLLNMLFALEYAAIKTLLYPINRMVVGKINFWEFIFGEDYLAEKEEE